MFASLIHVCSMMYLLQLNQLNFVSLWQQISQWFYLCSLVFSTDNTDSHDINLNIVENGVKDVDIWYIKTYSSSFFCYLIEIGL